ncbi:MAG: hypothetical protein JSW52_06410 [Candidatus Coatesbacteria bacterium]|nr:MAG: hypothetical protein JSW52_06410 [Candidatus Coatesbacteria bacterium]
MSRFLIVSLALLILTAGLAWAQPTEVVVFLSLNYLNPYVQNALDSLGWPYTVYYNSNEAAFRADVADGADIVVYNCPSNYDAASLDTLEDYVNDGGLLTMCHWAVSFHAGHGLWDAMEFDYVSEYFTPIPVYFWDDGHPVFNNPNTLSEPLTFSDGWARDGQRINPSGSAVAIAGYTTDEQDNEGAMVINSANTTIFNAFCWDEGTSAMTDLIENELTFLWEGGPPSAFSLLTPEDGEIIDVFTGRGGDTGFVAETMTTKNAGAVTFFNRTNDPVDVDVTFTWEEAANAEEYQILVDDDYTMVSPEVDEPGLTEETFTYTFSVDHTITYYWRVIASNENGDTPCNEDFEFEFNYNNTSIAPASLGEVKATFR